MDKYKVFSCWSTFDIEAKLNEHAQNGYVLRHVAMITTPPAGTGMSVEYLLILEHQRSGGGALIVPPSPKPDHPDVGGGAGDHNQGEGHS